MDLSMFVDLGVLFTSADKHVMLIRVAAPATKTSRVTITNV